MIVMSLFCERRHWIELGLVLLLGCFDKCLFNLELHFAPTVSMLQSWWGKDFNQCFWPCRFCGYMHRWTGMNEWYCSELLTSCFPQHRSLLTKSQQNLAPFFIFGLRASLNELLTHAVKLSQICPCLLLRSPISPGAVKSTDPWTMLQRQ